MASEGKPTTQRRKAVLKRAICRTVGGKHSGVRVELAAGDPVPDDLSAVEKARLKRLGVID